MVRDVGYPEESVTPRSDMRISTVLQYNIDNMNFFSYLRGTFLDAQDILRTLILNINIGSTKFELRLSTYTNYNLFSEATKNWEWLTIHTHGTNPI